MDDKRAPENQVCRSGTAREMRKEIPSASKDDGVEAKWAARAVGPERRAAA